MAPWWRGRQHASPGPVIACLWAEPPGLADMIETKQDLIARRQRIVARLLGTPSLKGRLLRWGKHIKMWTALRA